MSKKSITGYAKIATRRTDTGKTEAESIDVVWEDGGTEHFPANGMTAIIDEAIDRHIQTIGPGYPIMAMYDCMYSLSPSWKAIAREWRIIPTAKSSGEVYSLKLKRKDAEPDAEPAAVIFDLRHIMPRGMTGMAEVVDMERDGTAEQDCMIMREYAARFIDQYDLTDPRTGICLGSKVLTLTSLARYQVRREISQLCYERHGRRGNTARSLGQDYALDAAREAPHTYNEYAMRRACMRGGFTFVAAREALEPKGETLSIDETSAYHAHAICRYVPEEFKPKAPEWLQKAAEGIVSKSTAAVLYSYRMPFTTYMHVEVEFTGLRLRPGTVFAAQEIGLEGIARLYATSGVQGIDNESMVRAEEGIRSRGYADTIEGGVYAFAKVMEAKRLTTWVTEQELWCMAQVYEWESMRVIRGEATRKRKRPDDQAILTSMYFWTEKQEAKEAKDEARDSAEKAKLTAIYKGEIKPKFNSAGYGIHARDEYRPEWTIDDRGEWHLSEAISPETFDDRKPKRPRAWMNYGMRIAGGARMHLIIAMQLIWAAYGDRARIVAGDTDSLKITTDLTDEDILTALKPLHDATRTAIDRVTGRARTLWHGYYDPMDGVGEFVPEGRANVFYTAGPKQYITIDKGGAVDLTCAGIPKDSSYSAWLKCMVDRYGPDILPRVFTFGVTLAPNVSQLYEADYAKAAQAGELPTMSPVEYTLNEPTKFENAATIEWQRKRGRRVILNGIARAVWRPEGAVFMYQDGEL